jgi:hypothetical protein
LVHFSGKGKHFLEGHLSGFLTGLFFSLWYRKYPPYPEKYVFAETEFDSYFDEEGNFVPPKEEKDEEENL